MPSSPQKPSLQRETSKINDLTRRDTPIIPTRSEATKLLVSTPKSLSEVSTKLQSTASLLNEHCPEIYVLCEYLSELSKSLGDELTNLKLIKSPISTFESLKRSIRNFLNTENPDSEQLEGIKGIYENLISSIGGFLEEWSQFNQRKTDLENEISKVVNGLQRAHTRALNIGQSTSIIHSQIQSVQEVLTHIETQPLERQVELQRNLINYLVESSGNLQRNLQITSIERDEALQQRDKAIQNAENSQIVMNKALEIAKQKDEEKDEATALQLKAEEQLNHHSKLAQSTLDLLNEYGLTPSVFQNLRTLANSPKPFDPMEAVLEDRDTPSSRAIELNKRPLKAKGIDPLTGNKQYVEAGSDLYSLDINMPFAKAKLQCNKDWPKDLVHPDDIPLFNQFLNTPGFLPKEIQAIQIPGLLSFLRKVDEHTPNGILSFNTFPQLLQKQINPIPVELVDDLTKNPSKNKKLESAFFIYHMDKIENINPLLNSKNTEYKKVGWFFEKDKGYCIEVKNSEELNLMIAKIQKSQPELNVSLSKHPRNLTSKRILSFNPVKKMATVRTSPDISYDLDAKYDLFMEIKRQLEEYANPINQPSNPTPSLKERLAFHKKNGPRTPLNIHETDKENYGKSADDILTEESEQ